MTTTVSHPAPVKTARPLAVAAVAAGTFTIVTSEMLPVGLLTPIGADLGVSDGTAGLMMTAPGLVAAVAAPLITLAARRLDRRLVLCGLMALLAAANLLAALAPVYPIMLAARVLTGVSIGGFWAFAVGLAVRLVPEPLVGRAAATIASGIAVASVLGVPAGTLVSSVAGWRAAFAAVALLAVLLCVALARLLPALPAERAARVSDLWRVWRTGPLRVVLVVTALVVTGHFAAYTYVRPFLEQAAGAGATAVSAVLLGYGVAGVAGNFAAGARAARRPRGVLVTLALLIGVATAVLAAAPGSIGTATALLVLWGVAYGGVSVTLQMWIVRAGGGEAGMAMLTAVFNAAISLGAFAGGRVVDGASAPAVMWLGAGLSLAAAAVAGIAGRRTTNGS
ncbi:MFS transporter [Nonomuraea sp. SMC257]|uniref:MFS transporter n=1 Tax=Nonomuraea montanisoli TaxID=2741721 RepID=A0A7Y6IAW8_9ACTN|nr:MFS transporter [Nonomuraea montanisoli]NUW34875.1 MFS transporter [Nonomuraea montanisoli]